ncbi:PREDICTED: uncharacterized protein LOC106746455, partial [Dinoponera quadriceps]|uniref:Uncharacterized protein LOC106746455 n=1 Tax=Dinoponera quadriceps TaxID=609295 RepID=A0A6P3XJD3_DINQU
MATEWREAAVNEVHIMTDKASQSRRFSNLITGIHASGAISYGMNILMQICQNNVDEDGTPIREFTLKLHLPFEYIRSPRFELVQGLGWMHQLSTSAVNGVLNSLVITFVFYMGGQIEILCEALKDLSPGKYSHRLASSVLGELVVRHQKIITFSDKIEKIFCYIALMQFMSGTLVICCLGYMMMSSISSTEG